MTNNATTAANEFSGKTALVVDDGPIERLAGKSMLQKMGLSAQAAASGEEALRMLGAQPVDIAICDISMPGMSGLEAARAIRASDGLAGLPIIMLTARAQDSDIEQGLDAGADDYIVKPFSPRDLAARVDAALARRH